MSESEVILPELPIRIDIERMEKALAGPRFMLPPGLTAEQKLAVINLTWQATSAERERCARVALDEKVDAESTGDKTDVAYNLACDHIAAAIRKGS